MIVHDEELDETTRLIVLESYAPNHYLVVTEEAGSGGYHSESKHITTEEYERRYK